MQKRKMKKMGGPVFYRSWKEISRGKNVGKGGWEIDDEATGVLVDTVVDKKYGRTNYHIKVEEFNFELENDKGVAMVAGDILVLNGTGLLEKHLEDYPKGKAVTVIYKGEAEITSGEWEGTMAHNIEIYLEDGFESTDSAGADEEESADDLL